MLLLGAAVLLAVLTSAGVAMSQSDNLEKRSKLTVPVSDFARPSFHFTAPKNWLNGPNGMVYYDGEYHLFYQYHPYSNDWGPMHWGHAVSTDLVNWQHLSIANYLDELGYIFSGCAIIDWKNAAGFGKEAMIGFFTHRQSVFIDRTRSGQVDFHPEFPDVHRGPYVPDSDTIRLHLFVDRPVIELFVDDGLLAFGERVFPNKGHHGIEVYSAAGPVLLRSFDLFSLRAADFYLPDPLLR